MNHVKTSLLVAPCGAALMLLLGPTLSLAQSPVAPSPIVQSPANPAAQSPLFSPAPGGHWRRVPNPSKTNKAPDPLDDFTDLTYSPDQKARIEQIRESSRTRMHDVAVDTKLSPEQRGAMIDGIQRLERFDVYKLLTAEQQADVRKRAAARREAAQREKQRQAGSSATSPTPLTQSRPPQSAVAGQPTPN